MLISLSPSAFASNRFLFLFALKTKLHQEFDKHSNQMSCEHEIIIELGCVYGNRERHLARVMLHGCVIFALDCS